MYSCTTRICRLPRRFATRATRSEAEVQIKWIDSEHLTKDTLADTMQEVDGILVPGGFGGRGIEGMILAAQYARENRLPYFGICLGMQVAVIEFARHAAGIADADSGEFNEICKHKVIDFMPGQSDEIDKGGTLRLGACPCVISPAQPWRDATERWRFPSATATATSSITIIACR